jgi:RNA polymerase sigma-70 factor (ECF subfamily)
VTVAPLRSEGIHQVFADAVEPHRRELLVHCYQMLGSVADAQDLVQETMERAWRAYDRYDPTRASMRTWLYRIATNACLNALDSRRRRPLPSGVGKPFDDPEGPFVPGFEVPWLQPFPDRAFGGPPADPAEQAVERSRIRLAFVAALQLLSAKERAVLILREVLTFTAQEVAATLNTTVPAVNSALQRARATVGRADPKPESMSEPVQAMKATVDHYMSAFERADVAALARLLADEVVLEMPPMWNWYQGRTAYAGFMRRVFSQRGTSWRTLPTSANGQSAMVAYAHQEGGYRLHTLQVFTTGAAGTVTRTTVYQDPDVFALFDLARTID